VRIRGNDACNLCNVGSTVILRNALLKFDKNDNIRLELDRFSKVEISDIPIEQIDLSKNVSDTKFDKQIEKVGSIKEEKD